MDITKNINTTKKAGDKIIYVSHEFGGNTENIRKVTEIILKLNKKFPNYTFISPIHNFQMLYKVVDYETGIKKCLQLLDLCDECWIFGEHLSKGVNAELWYCREKHIPYKVIDADFGWVNNEYSNNLNSYYTSYYCHKNDYDYKVSNKKCGVDCIMGCDFWSLDSNGAIYCKLVHNKKYGIPIIE